MGEKERCKQRIEDLQDDVEEALHHMQRCQDNKRVASEGYDAEYEKWSKIHRAKKKELEEAEGEL